MYNYIVDQLQNFKLQMQPQAVLVSDFYISKVTNQKILVSDDMDIDLDPFQSIAQVFSKPFNPEPHTSRLRTQTRFLTPVSCDLEPDISLPVSDLSISKVNHQNIFASADLDPDMDPYLDPVQSIARVFRKTSNHDPHTSRLQTQTRFFTPLCCDIETEITNPTSRKIVVSSDLDPDPSSGLDSKGVIDQGFRGPFLPNISCHDFENFDEGRKMSSQLWVCMAGYRNYISSIYVFIPSFVSLIKYVG